jgi:Family of unknown function (DUF6191)
MSWSGVGEIFNPGQRHLREEMDRKQIEAKIPGNEGDGETQVDLENNVVRIPQPRPKDPADPADPADPVEPADAAGGAPADDPDDE